MRVLGLIAILLGWAGLTFACTVWVIRRGWAPRARNYRGVELPLCLGFALALLVLWPVLFRSVWIVKTSAQTTWGQRIAMTVSLLVVFLAGWYDDARGGPARGLRGHFAELAKGQVTPGLVKLLAIVGAAAVTAASLEDDVGRMVLGIPVIAGSANLWNLMDVRPGRAVKYFLVAGLVLVGWDARFDDFLLAAALASAAAVLPFDLRERAMLGDAGSNLLGFVIGLALFRVLPTWGLWVALGLILLLHALGETVTLSRMIDSAPPLRWFDQLGRLSPHQARRGLSSPRPRSSSN